MSNARVSHLHELSARIDAHLHQFMDEETPYYSKYPIVAKEHRKSPAARLGKVAVAGGAVVGGSMAYDSLKKRMPAIKAGAKDAAFTGTRKVAAGMNSVGNKLVPRKRGVGDAIVGGAVEKVGKGLKKGSRRLRKASMRFFEDGAADHEFGSASLRRMGRVGDGVAKKAFKGGTTDSYDKADDLLKRLRMKYSSKTAASGNRRAKSGVNSYDKLVSESSQRRVGAKIGIRAKQEFSALAERLVNLEVKLQSI